ncbi:MAG TPA: hypothetical protein VHW72_10765, partial [Candidatus Angelobacter sp.]|nr:hypothetical protein [Candidatus Angelobacter sp.]
MRRLLIMLLLPFGAWMVHAEDNANRHSSTVTMNDDSSSDDCREHLRVGRDDYRASVRDEEVKTIPNQPLTIT